VLAHGWAQNWPHTQRWLVVLGVIGVVALSLQVYRRLSQLG